MMLSIFSCVAIIFKLICTDINLNTYAIFFMFHLLRCGNRPFPLTRVDTEWWGLTYHWQMSWKEHCVMSTVKPEMAVSHTGQSPVGALHYPQWALQFCLLGGSPGLMGRLTEAPPANPASATDLAVTSPQRSPAPSVSINPNWWISSPEIPTS